MRFRALAVLPVAAMAILSVTGCESKVGAAAVVNGHRIAETDVTKLVNSNASNPGQARSYALNYLILDNVFSTALKRNGGLPSDNELASYHDLVLATLLPSQTGATTTDKDLQNAVGTLGLKASFATLLVRGSELEQALAKKVGATAAAALLQELTKEHISVSVSPRFGHWDATTMSLTDLGKAQLPEGVELGTVLPGDKPPAQ
ncbi:MAG TPA: hypothetical protein VGH11_14710 [Jatrophihabitans sp.]